MKTRRALIIGLSIASAVAVSSPFAQSASASDAHPDGINIGFAFNWSDPSSQPEGMSASFIMDDGESLNNCSGQVTADMQACNFAFDYSVDGNEQVGIEPDGDYGTFDGQCPETLTLFNCFNDNSFGQVFFAGATGELTDFSMSMTCLNPSDQEIQLYAVMYEVQDGDHSGPPGPDSVSGSLVGDPLGSVLLDLSDCPTLESWDDHAFTSEDFAVISMPFEGVSLEEGVPYGVYFAGDAVPGVELSGAEDLGGPSEPACDRCTGAGRGGGGGGSSSPDDTSSADTDSSTQVAGDREFLPGTNQPATPILNSEGSLPELTPGTPLGTIDGAPVVVQLATLSDGTGVQLSGEGFSLSMSVPGTSSSSGLNLVRSGDVQVSGDGFAPGSLVDVWLFSTPTPVGTVTVGADGRFTGTLALPASIAPGSHTLQVNGVASGGSARSLNLGVQVVDQNFTLPRTGQGADPLALLGWWTLAAGLFISGLRRTRMVR